MACDIPIRINKTMKHLIFLEAKATDKKQKEVLEDVLKEHFIKNEKIIIE